MAFNLPDNISSGILERLEILAAKKDITVSGAISQLKGPNSAASEWKKGKAKPSLAAVVSLADFFGVSLDYLVYGKENNVAAIESLGLTKSQSELLKKFDKLTPELQQRLIAYADFLMADMPDVKNEKGRLLG